MDSIHKSSDRPWISEPVKVKQFRDDWYARLNNWKSDTQEVFKLSEAEYADIEKQCGLDAMECSFQNNLQISKDLNIPENVNLQTLKVQKEVLERRKADSYFDARAYALSRVNNYPSNKMANDDIERIKGDPVEIVEPEVLLSVQIFRPEKRYPQHMLPIIGKGTGFQIDQEFMVLGCQDLTELRDKIDCVSDHAIPGDYSEHPDLPPEITCKELYKSGYFYINGVFYNDMRDPDCRDYSEVIIEWTKSRDRGIGPFHKALMVETKFIDLEIQLGYPYLYTHQGNCEHLIVFSDMVMYRKQHHDNDQRRYPAYISVKEKKRVFCMVCKVRTTAWIVYDNKKLPENPFFLCKLCFKSYCYDENDEKITDFRAYHHIDRSKIL